MKTLNFQNRDEWMFARRGKITGSRLKDLIVKRGTGKKKGYYELIAERIAVEPTDENPMERGNRLEAEAIARFTKETGKEVDTSLIMWTRDDDESIAVSPDGIINETEAIEVKCLSSASHIEAFLTQEVPSEYQDQTVQYFCVNDTLQTLYMVFYDPRMSVKDYFTLEVKRDEIQSKIDEYLEYQMTTLNEIEEIVANLTNF